MKGNFYKIVSLRSSITNVKVNVTTKEPYFTTNYIYVENLKIKDAVKLFVVLSGTLLQSYKEF